MSSPDVSGTGDDNGVRRPFFPLEVEETRPTARVSSRWAPTEEPSSGDASGDFTHASTRWSDLLHDAKDPKDIGLDWEQVLKEERHYLNLSNSERQEDGRRERPFALAFSGGGVRAAAFQAGVLWRLARVGALQDVEHLAAVSGGGYIASAFASHCYHANPPERGKVKAWYLEVVARTICRMQRNAGNFVRDACAHPGTPEDGAGHLPRIFDLPILIAMLIFTVAMNPVFFIIACLVPFAAGVKVVFGAGMRAAFCSEGDWVSVLRAWSPIDKLGIICIVAVAVTFVASMLKRLLPTCQLRKGPDGVWRAGQGYLVGHATNAFLVRFTVFIVFFFVFIYAMVWVQLNLYYYAERGDLLKSDSCSSFIERRNASGLAMCIDFSKRREELWYESAEFREQRDRWKVRQSQWHKLDHGSKQIQQEQELRDIFTFFCLCLMALMGAGIIFAPILGSDLTILVLKVAGPFVLTVLSMQFTQIAVYGPITDADPGIRWLPNDRNPTKWRNVQDLSLGTALIIVPLYPWIRSALHKYYTHCLQSNFFHKGCDIPFAQLLKNSYCPLLILTGTCSDYQPPGATDLISELYFSALHCGCDDLGYLRMPPHRSLAKCTALTGAGCLDAISLTMADAMTLRFWLEVLNLTWGDYIIFERYPLQVMRYLINSAGPRAATVDRILHSSPSGIIWLLIYMFMNLANLMGRDTRRLSAQNSSFECHTQKSLFCVAASMLSIMLLLSFIPHLPFHDILASDALIRQIHQATRYFYVGHRPPRMLYVTDGGVKDCTAVIQLMRRRCRRIFLILAAADASDDLNVLKTMMKVAVDEKIGSFFNPADPQECIEILFDKYKRDRSMPYLHLGICYSWDSAEGGGRTADLYIVKNRLPCGFEAQPVIPLLTPEEIRGEKPVAKDSAAFDYQAWEGITTDTLGSCGCCDCCHRQGMNCGPKFPHGSFLGYMYLSPQWCNSLIRLGFEMSGPVVEAVTGRTLDEAVATETE